MGFEVVKILSAKQKEKKTEESLQWLQEQGVLPDLQLINSTLTEARTVIQILQEGLHMAGQINTDTSKLTARIDSLLQTIKA